MFQALFDAYAHSVTRNIFKWIICCYIFTSACDQSLLYMYKWSLNMGLLPTSFILNFHRLSSLQTYYIPKDGTLQSYKVRMVSAHVGTGFMFIVESSMTCKIVFPSIIALNSVDSYAITLLWLAMPLFDYNWEMPSLTNTWFESNHCTVFYLNNIEASKDHQTSFKITLF